MSNLALRESGIDPNAATVTLFHGAKAQKLVDGMSTWVISSIVEHHERGQFDCGEPSLDDFLKQYARQNEEKGVGRTFVLTREGELRVLGYYTLAGGQFEREHLPAKAAKKLPKYPVPVVVLGRLAVDRSVQGEKLGRELLKDAFRRALIVSEQVGCYAVCVRALNTKAAEFYARFGFIPFVTDPLQLYLPIATIRAAAAAEG